MVFSLFDDMEQCTEEEVQRLLAVVSPQRREEALRIKHLSGRFACLKSYEMLMNIVNCEIVNSELTNARRQPPLSERGRGYVSNNNTISLNANNVIEGDSYKMAPGPTWSINEHGKPYFPQRPDIHFNISHCKHAIAVVVDDKEVGIDVERYVNPTPSLLRYTMNDQEVALVEQSERPEQTFAMLWTQKEALFKLYGTGITDDIRQLLTLPRPSVALTTTYHKDYCCTIATIEN